jgi:hypothetical protein
MAAQLCVDTTILKAAKEAIVATIPTETVQHFDRFMRGTIIEQIKAKGGTPSPDLVNMYMNRLLCDREVVTAYFRNELEKSSVFQQITKQALTRDNDGYFTLNSNELDKAIKDWIGRALPTAANTSDIRSALYSEYVESFEGKRTDQGLATIVPTKVERVDYYRLLKELGIRVNVTAVDTEGENGNRFMVITVSAKGRSSNALLLSDLGLRDGTPLARHFEGQLAEKSKMGDYKGPALDSRQIALIAAFCTEEFNWHARMMAEAQKRDDDAQN